VELPKVQHIGKQHIGIQRLVIGGVMQVPPAMSKQIFDSAIYCAGIFLAYGLRHSLTGLNLAVCRYNWQFDSFDRNIAKSGELGTFWHIRSI
jgi:hypothetical protein